VAVPAAAHTTWNKPRSGSMITRIARLWPIGGIPLIVKPESSFASRAVARRTSRAPVTAASRARSTRLGPDTRHRIGSRTPSSPGATKTSDLTIWPISAPTAAAASSAVWVDLSNTLTSRVTPFLLAASTTRWMAGWSRGSGTAGSLASGPGCRFAPRRFREAAWAVEYDRSMVTRVLILAGGSGPRRAELNHAWPGWDEALEFIIAADAGALLAEPLGLRLDLVVGDGDSLGDSALAELGRSGVAIDRSPADKDASDTELALIAAGERGATDVIVLGAFGGRVDHHFANVWILAHPALAGRTVTLLDGRTRVR